MKKTFFLKESWKELSNEEDDPPELSPPPPLPPPRDPYNGLIDPSFIYDNADFEVEFIQTMKVSSLGWASKPSWVYFSIQLKHII